LFESDLPRAEGFIGVQGIARNITARRRAEEEVRRLVGVISGTPVGLMLLGADRRVQYVNPAFEVLTGYPAAEMLGAGLTDTRLHASALGTAMESILAAGAPQLMRCTVTRVDGRETPAALTMYQIFDGGGQVINHVLRVEDLSEQARLEEEVRQAIKLEAIGTLASGIAHDFNNVLASIMGYAELALGAVPPGGGAAEDLAQVLVGGRRAAELTQQILTFARKANYQPQAVRLSLVVREALKLLRASLPATIMVHDRVDTESGYVLADPSQLHQVVMNLCTNAYQAMGDAGGTLTVTLHRAVLTDTEAARGIAGLPAGEYLCLTVADTGPGMPKDVRDHVFEPFFTTKPVGVGTGLGLAVTHSIAVSHGGAISVDSEPGHGTAFHVWLPRHHVADAETGSDHETAQSAGAGHILVVDDEPTLARLVARMIEKMGFRATACDGPDEALRLWEENPGGFDLLVTDQIMPGLTGLDLAARLRTGRPDLPVVLITGYGGTVPERIDDAGIEVLTKPIDSARLAELVQDLLASSEPPATPLS
jgi:PAS domain S-box-containing protein